MLARGAKHFPACQASVRRTAFVFVSYFFLFYVNFYVIIDGGRDEKLVGVHRNGCWEVLLVVIAVEVAVHCG